MVGLASALLFSVVLSSEKKRLDGYAPVASAVAAEAMVVSAEAVELRNES
jgi:hypothetical protein